MANQEKGNRPTPIMIRVTREEHDTLSQRAHDACMTVSAYIRTCALGRKPRSQVDTHVIEELRRLGSQQRELAQSATDTLTVQYAAVLVEIIGAMRRLGA